MQLNGKKVVNIQMGGVDGQDYPDFCDAYFEEAEYQDGTPLTGDELEELAELYPEVLNEMAYDSLIP